MELSEFLSNGIDALIGAILPLIGILAAIGGASMALWQVWKDLYPVHRNFNKALVREWAASATDDLIKLTVVGSDATDALYSLSTAQLVAQLQAAGRIAVADPRKNEQVLRFLVGNDALVDAFINDTPEDGDEPGDEPAAPLSEADLRAAALRQSQVEHYVQRNFDGLQMRADWRWGRRNRLAALVLSVVITSCALWGAGTIAMPHDEGWSLDLLLAYAPTALAAGIVAGFLAPVGKDLVRALKALRDR